MQGPVAIRLGGGYVVLVPVQQGLPQVLSNLADPVACLQRSTCSPPRCSPPKPSVAAGVWHTNGTQCTHILESL